MYIFCPEHPEIAKILENGELKCGDNSENDKNFVDEKFADLQFERVEGISEENFLLICHKRHNRNGAMFGVGDDEAACPVKKTKPCNR